MHFYVQLMQPILEQKSTFKEQRVEQTRHNKQTHEVTFYKFKDWRQNGTRLGSVFETVVHFSASGFKFQLEYPLKKPVACVMQSVWIK